MNQMNLPNIALLPTPNNDYFYDANRNEFVPISKKTSKALRTLLHKGELPQVSPEVEIEINRLKHMGYLSNRTIDKIKHPLTEYIQYLLNRKMSQVVLQITQNCNFRCDYCIYTAPTPGVQRTHQNKKMSWETAKNAIDYLWDHSIDSETIGIGFYGGEPLLEYELIKKVVVYAEKIFCGKAVQFSLTTNASLLDSEKADFFYAHQFILIFSLDGPEWIQNRNRKPINPSISSYEIVSSNIKSLIERYPDYVSSLGINMVIDPADNMDDIFSIIQPDKIYSGIKTQATLINDDFLQEKRLPGPQYQAQFEYHMFLCILGELNFIDLSYKSPLAEGVVKNALYTLKKKLFPTTEIPEITSTGGMCIPGINKLFVNADGQLFTCERVSETSRAGYLGNISNGIDVESAKRLLNVANLTYSKCKKCWAYRFCPACVSNCDNGHDLDVSIRLSNCQRFKDNIAYKMKIILLSLQTDEILNMKDGTN